MTSFREIIDVFTVKHLATILGLPESHVRTMRARDSIPPEYWPDVIGHAPDKLGKLTFEALVQLRKSKIAASDAA